MEGKTWKGNFKGFYVAGGVSFDLKQIKLKKTARSFARRSIFKKNQTIFQQMTNKSFVLSFRENDENLQFNGSGQDANGQQFDVTDGAVTPSGQWRFIKAPFKIKYFQLFFR